MTHDILALDRAGSPSRWINVNDAAWYYAKDMILGDCGDRTVELRGGQSVRTGGRSILRINSIVFIKGERVLPDEYRRPAPVVRELLFQRDRHICAYCGDRFRGADLSMDHIYPRAHGGVLTWMNLISACRPCNTRKQDRTPEAAKMPLLFAPYVPSRNEVFILSNRRILADQMSLLLAQVPKGSRLHA